MNATEYSTKSILDIVREGHTAVVIPRTNLSEFEYNAIQSGDNEIFDVLSDPGVLNVVLDFHRTDYFGSSAMAFFLHVWKRMRERQGRMVLCNLSEHEKEILKTVKLDRIWPICASLREALRLIRDLPAPTAA